MIKFFLKALLGIYNAVMFMVIVVTLCINHVAQAKWWVPVRHREKPAPSGSDVS